MDALGYRRGSEGLLKLVFLLLALITESLYQMVWFLL